VGILENIRGIGDNASLSLKLLVLHYITLMIDFTRTRCGSECTFLMLLVWHATNNALDLSLHTVLDC